LSRQLFFKREHFLRGVIKLEDLKPPPGGVRILGKDGKSRPTKWIFNQDMNGKWFTPYDPAYMLKKYPTMVWKDEAAYDKYVAAKEAARLKANKVSADKRQKQLATEAKDTGDDDDLKQFKKERARLKR
jgi:hypothetical protein